MVAEGIVRLETILEVRRKDLLEIVDEWKEKYARFLDARTEEERNSIFRGALEKIPVLLDRITKLTDAYEDLVKDYKTGMRALPP
jgi:hypothetical protein